jgi:SAM-dependent methyltransferase
MTDETRIANEKAFHNESFSTGLRSQIDSYYEIFIAIRDEFRRRVTTALKGKNGLELGCGPTTLTPEYAQFASHIKGIDISEEAVRQSREKAEQAGLRNVDFDVMNAEDMQLPAQSVSVIFGSGIIHHLDLHAFFREARRVLTPDGRILFMEPLGHNPLINTYRRLTPRMRTPDEHPLLRSDLALLRANFRVVDVKFYYFWSLFAIPFRHKRVFGSVLRTLDGLDRAMFRVAPFTKTWAWYALIDASHPRDTPSA